ncbi:hypothetical protein PCE1_004057 [Barthelona sp. PCE]
MGSRIDECFRKLRADINKPFSNAGVCNDLHKPICDQENGSHAETFKIGGRMFVKGSFDTCTNTYEVLKRFAQPINLTRLSVRLPSIVNITGETGDDIATVPLMKNKKDFCSNESISLKDIWNTDPKADVSELKEQFIELGRLWHGRISEFWEDLEVRTLSKIESVHKRLL